MASDSSKKNGLNEERPAWIIVKYQPFKPFWFLNEDERNDKEETECRSCGINAKLAKLSLEMEETNRIQTSQN